MDTYRETVLRYRIMVHEELPEAHKAELRLKGVDPDDRWGLKWSFSDRAKAEECLANEQADAASWQTFRLIDAGQATTIERPIY